MDFSYYAVEAEIAVSQAAFGTPFNVGSAFITISLDAFLTPVLKKRAYKEIWQGLSRNGEKP